MTSDVRLRALTTDDIPAWNRLLADIEKVERTGEHYNEADLAEEMANPDIEIGKDVVGAVAGDDLVGYFQVYARSTTGDVHKLHLSGGVRPDRRGQGIGTALAEAMRARALEAHAERYPRLTAVLTLTGPSANESQARLMSDIGLVPERWGFTMRAQLADFPDAAVAVPDAAVAVPDAAVAVPDGLVGLELRRYDDALGEAMFDAHNAAFVDHPNFTPWTEAMWKQWVTGSRSFRPSLSFVVVDPERPDRVAAYLQTSEFDAYFEETGRREAYVAKVGTRREYRGRGLASTLLRHALAEYRAAGYDEAALDVDSENPTGALGMYRRAGFEVESRSTDYIARVAPAGRGEGTQS